MAYGIGIDLGGSYIKYGLTDETGTIGYESVRPTYVPDRDVYTNIVDAIQEISAYAVSRGLTPAGIGIGVPGILDAGVVTGCAANLPEIDGMDLGSRVEAQLGMPVWVENDANLMGLAEWKFGAARDTSDAIFLTIGTGIGGAMVIDGRLYSGYRNRGAELGHIIVESNGLPCGCGGRGCLEAYASVTALIEEYKRCLHSIRQEPDAAITGSLIVSRYLSGQPAAVQALNRHFDYLAAGIAGLINIFSPQKLIIGGGISEAGETYIGPIRQRAMERAMKETSIHTVIEAAQLGNKAGFLGAAALVFNATSSI